jgi:L,D-transpeptidase catalytic domain
MRLARTLFAFILVVACLFAVSTAQAAVLITIDKSAQRMSVSVDGATRWTWPVSTGGGNRATPSGSFQPFRMEATHFSKEWDDAPMPHSIFFTKVGHAIHGTYDVAHLGSAVSHGCVRLSAANATQLYRLVKAEGMPNTKVAVTGEQPYGEPEAYNQSQGQSSNGGFFGQSSYGQNSYNQSSYGQNSYGQNSYGQSSYGQNSYGQNSYGQNSYGQNSHSQSSTSQSANGRNGNPRASDGGFFFFNPRN